MQSKNTLYYGDNLDILRRYVENESVDLIYLDPPFKSDRDYNVLFAEKNGTRSSAQIKAFKDTWQWDREAAEAYQDAVEAGGAVSEAMQAFRKLLGCNDMLAYLAMMAPRLVEFRRVLKPTGSIYLHCDPTASPYLRLLTAAVFGKENFRNEIVWQRTTAHSNIYKSYGRLHDVIIFHGKSGESTWNVQFTDYSEEHIERTYRHIEEDTGRRYALRDLTASMSRASSGQLYEWKGIRPPETRCWAYTKRRMRAFERAGQIEYSSKGYPRLKLYLDEMPGIPLQDIWTDIRPVQSQSRERLGYPTQKPEALLERIISASSNEGDLVLDPFCGCGTTICAAQRLNRRWIGIDITHLAVTLIKYRLENTFGENIKMQFEVVGEPVSISGAMALAKENPYQFQWWALGLVGARPVEQRKGADEGIDGRLYFHDEGKEGETKQIVFSVKSGHVAVSHVRDLRGVMDREGADMGVLITMLPPTRPMRVEATRAGFYESPVWQKRYPRIQILTVEDLMRGKGIDCPPLRHTNVTFKRAPKARRPPNDNNSELFD